MFSWSRCQNFLRGKTAIILHIQIHSLWFCHSDKTGIFHNKSSRYSQNNTLVFFHNSKKRGLGKYLKEKPQMAGKEQNHIPVESTHVQTLTCPTQAEHSVWICLVMHSHMGWSSNPTCKTTAAKFTKCLESRSVSHHSLTQSYQRQPVCTCGR